MKKLLIIACMILPFIGNGQIVYTNANDTVVLSDFDLPMGTYSADYDFDIDNDGQRDFSFEIRKGSLTNLFNSITISKDATYNNKLLTLVTDNPLGSNPCSNQIIDMEGTMVCSDTDLPSPYSAGDIGSTGYLGGANIEWETRDLHNGDVSLYLGVRFQRIHPISGNLDTHYGYIHIGLGANHALVIHSYAWNPVADACIMADDYYLPNSGIICTTNIDVYDTTTTMLFDTTNITVVDTNLFNDTTFTNLTVIDTVLFNDTLLTTVYDSIINTIYDTVPLATVYDTVPVYDTVFVTPLIVTIYDTVTQTVVDSLVITTIDTIPVFDSIAVPFNDTTFTTIVDTMIYNVIDTLVYNFVDTLVFNMVVVDTNWITLGTYLDTITTTVTVMDTVDCGGSNKMKNGDNLSVYPNPTVETLNIKGFDSYSDYYLIDILGRKTEVHDDILDVSYLSAGMYTIEKVDEFGEREFAKFNKQ